MALFSDWSTVNSVSSFFRFVLHLCEISVIYMGQQACWPPDGAICCEMFLTNQGPIWFQTFLLEQTNRCYGISHPQISSLYFLHCFVLFISLFFNKKNNHGVLSPVWAPVPACDVTFMTLSSLPTAAGLGRTQGSMSSYVSYPDILS